MSSLFFRGLHTFILLFFLTTSAAFATHDIIIVKDASQLPAGAIRKISTSVRLIRNQCRTRVKSREAL
jgi:hypothetical protein